MKTFELVLYLDIIAFLFFGVTCIYSARMQSEFIRFQLTDRIRLITGVLQLIAVAGLIGGIIYPLLGFIAATGLALQMSAGFVVRLKIKDGVYKSSPALIFMLLNMIIAYRFYLMI